MSTRSPILSPSDHADRAERLRQEGRLEEALEAVRLCLKEKPNHARGLLLLTRLLYQKGRIPEAAESLGPLTSVLGGEKQLKTISEALQELWRIRSSQLDSAFVTETMARILARQGYLLEAMEIYRRLFLVSENKKELWEEIVNVRDRLKIEGSREAEKDKVARELEALEYWMQEIGREL